MKRCASCDSEHADAEIFCSTCGSRLVQLEPGGNPVETHEKLSPQKRPLWGGLRKRISKRVVVVSSSVLVLSLVAAAGVPLAIDAYERAQEEAAAAALAEERRLAAESLQAAFDETTLGEFLPNCDPLSDVVNSDAYQHEMEIGEDLDRITNAREAAAIRNDVEFPDQTVAENYTASVEDASLEGLTDLFESSDRDDIAKPEQIARWEEQWKTFVLNECGLSERYAEVQTIFDESLAAKERFLTLADRAPWYPEDYSELIPGIAYKWVDAPSDCYSCYQWDVDFLSQTGCDSVYAEVNISDSSGRVIGWANDSLRSIQPGDVGRLSFQEFLRGRGTLTANFSDFRCS